MTDPRNPRIDDLIQGSHGQHAVALSGFDASSPVSMDFNFPFSGSPQDSSNSGIDAPPDLRMNHGFPPRGSMSEATHVTGQKSSGQHRGSLASIDSVFDQDMFGGLNQWNALQTNNQANDNSDASPSKGENDQDKKGVEDDKLPAWSELKTKAGKERKRLPLACIACRRKKIRCSGEKPACKHCLKARVPCVYKVTTRKAAPRTDYMAMLDKRLKRMEDRVIKVIPKEEQPDFTATGRSSVRPPLPGSTPKTKEKTLSTRKRSADEAFTHELAEWTSRRKQGNVLDATANRKREPENQLFIEGAESLPPQHIQEHLAEVFFDCVYGQSYLLLHKPSFMRKLRAGTVPPVLTLAVCAISARFSTHPQVSTEPAFLRGEQWATPARTIVEKRHFEPNITILTVMLILGLHHFGTCEGGLSWSFGGQAMRMGYALQLHRELDHDPLGRNQKKKADGTIPKPPELSFTDREIRRRTMWACFLMDTFNSSGTERPSFLNEEYFHIQLPIKESNFQLEIPGPTEDLNGNVPIATLPRPSGVPKASNTPDSITMDGYSSDPKSNMGCAAYIVRAVVLWKRIIKYLNLGGIDLDPHPIWDPLSQFGNLQRQIINLKSTLPSDLTYTPTNLTTHISARLANQFLFLHITIAQTSLFLHRFAIPTQPTTRTIQHQHPNMPRSFISNSANAVITAASDISHYISDSTGHTLTVPFAGYCAYAAATVHVWGIFSRSPALEVSSKENLRHNYKYLTRMKRYWGMFHYMAESVKDIYRCFAEAAANNKLPPAVASAAVLRAKEAAGGDSALATPNSSRQGTPDPSAGKDSASGTARKSMFQYGDWFDKYPHGVSETEWEQTHRQFKSEGDGGSEAVMSARSDLQSVEEFFASLSPPSKADEGTGGIGPRGKKVPRRRGKSVVENAGAAQGKKGESAAKSGQTQGPGQGLQRKFSSNAVNQASSAQTNRAGANAPATQPQSIDVTSQPFSAADFDITSPELYQTPQLPSGSQPNQDFQYSNNSFLTALPHWDRQMVFDAYAGINPSTSSSQFNLNPWDSVDINGYSFPDPVNNGMSGMGSAGINSSAWLLPFNIDPPSYSGMSDTGSTGGYGLDEFAKAWNATEGMDMDLDTGISGTGAETDHQGQT